MNVPFGPHSCPTPDMARRALLRASFSLGTLAITGCGGGGPGSSASPVLGTASFSASAVPPGTSSVSAPPYVPIVPVPSGPLPAWASPLPLWEWYEIPNTALSALDSSLGIVTGNPPGITGPSSKITAWCGATLKRQGSVYLLGACGGHGDYAGNEVDALALNTDTPQWGNSG